MLGIPTTADPSEHLAHLNITSRPDPKRHVDEDLPTLGSRNNRSRASPELNAILVEDDNDSDLEAGEIVEVFLSGAGGLERADRFSSVSEDDLRDEQFSNIEADREDGESRYAVRSRQSRIGVGVVELDSDSDSDSVVAIEIPGVQARTAGKTAAQARRDFWAAKGRRQVEVEDDLDIDSSGID